MVDAGRCGRHVFGTTKHYPDLDLHLAYTKTLPAESCWQNGSHQTIFRIVNVNSTINLGQLADRLHSCLSKDQHLIARMVALTTSRDEADLNRVETLGSVRLHRQDTHEVILIPTPSDDPNDPLNWYDTLIQPSTTWLMMSRSARYRYYMAALVCLAMVMCNFLAAGPTVAIVEITIDFFGTPPPSPSTPSPGFAAAIAKVAYFFTTTALLQGMGNLVWMPLIVKFGRRPVYLGSFTLYKGCAIWAGVSRSYTSELAARIIMGFAAGSGECIAPLTIADIFFLHERGLIMA